MSESFYPDEREAAACLLSACATECATSGNFVFMQPIAEILFHGWPLLDGAIAIELAGLAWRHTQTVLADAADMNHAEMYAECEALIREGWEPSDE